MTATKWITVISDKSYFWPLSRIFGASPESPGLPMCGLYSIDSP